METTKTESKKNDKKSYEITPCAMIGFDLGLGSIECYDYISLSRIEITSTPRHIRLHFGAATVDVICKQDAKEVDVNELINGLKGHEVSWIFLNGPVVDRVAFELNETEFKD